MDLLEDLPDPFRLLRDDRGVAVQLDQQKRPHLAGETDSGVVLHAVDRRLVHDFERCGDDPRGDDFGDRLAGGPDIPEIGEKRPLVLRRVDQTDRHFGDDAEGPLASDQQVAQGVAGHILHAFVSGVKFRAVVEEPGEGHHIIPGDAVFEAPEAARVLRNVAAERRYVLGTGVGRVEKTLCRRGIEEIDCYDARFGGQGQILLIDLPNSVHPGEAEDHTSPERGAASGEAGRRATRGDGETLPAAHLQGGLQPLPVLRKDGHVGKPRDFRCCVITVDEEILSFMIDVSGADLLPEVIDDGFVQHGIPPPTGILFGFFGEIKNRLTMMKHIVGRRIQSQGEKRGEIILDRVRKAC